MAYNEQDAAMLMGIETEIGFEKKYFVYQHILDNISLLDDETVDEMNELIIELRHGVFKKKKEEEALCLKTDSFVVESNIHFPTGYNLLWDRGRKCLAMISYFINEYPEIKGWRKLAI